MRFENKKLLKSMSLLNCEMCGQKNNNAAHHIITKARQGGDYDWNLMTLCFPCHRDWHDKGIRFMLEKFNHLHDRLMRRGFDFDEYSGKLYRNNGEEA